MIMKEDWVSEEMSAISTFTWLLFNMTMAHKLSSKSLCRMNTPKVNYIYKISFRCSDISELTVFKKLYVNDWSYVNTFCLKNTLPYNLYRYHKHFISTYTERNINCRTPDWQLKQSCLRGVSTRLLSDYHNSNITFSGIVHHVGMAKWLAWVPLIWQVMYLRPSQVIPKTIIKMVHTASLHCTHALR